MLAPPPLQTIKAEFFKKLIRQRERKRELYIVKSRISLIN